MADLLGPGPGGSHTRAPLTATAIGTQSTGPTLQHMGTAERRKGHKKYLQSLYLATASKYRDKATLFATVVVLGAYASTINTWDFWLLTLLIFFQGGLGMGSSNHPDKTLKAVMMLMRLVLRQGRMAPWRHPRAVAVYGLYEQSSPFLAGFRLFCIFLTCPLEVLMPFAFIALSSYRLAVAQSTWPTEDAERNLHYGLCLVYSLAIFYNFMLVCHMIALAAYVFGWNCDLDNDEWE